MKSLFQIFILLIPVSLFSQINKINNNTLYDIFKYNKEANDLANKIHVLDSSKIDSLEYTITTINKKETYKVDAIKCNNNTYCEFNIKDVVSPNNKYFFKNSLHIYKQLPVGEYIINSKHYSGLATHENISTLIVDTIIDTRSYLYSVINHQIISLYKENINPVKIKKQLDVFFKKKSINPIISIDKKSVSIEIYADSVYYGRYYISFKDLLDPKFLKQQINNYNSEIKEPLSNLISDFDQLQVEELQGSIGINYEYQNQPDLYSTLNPQNLELYSNLSMPVMGVPININAFYTNQDKNRKIKSSYLNFSYDTEILKQKYLELLEIGTQYYTNRKNESLSLIDNFESKLKNDKVNIETIKNNIKQTLIDEISSGARYLNDSINKVADSLVLIDDIDSIKMIYKQIKTNKDLVKSKIEELENKVQEYEKYKNIFDRNRKVLNIDSIMYDDKIKYLKEEALDQLNFQQVKSRYNELLGIKNKFSSVTSLLNNLKIGTFSNALSKYTNSGQYMNGVSLGFDIKQVKLDVSTGSVKKNDFNNNTKKINTYSLALSTNLNKNTDISLSVFSYGSSKNELDISNESISKDLISNYVKSKFNEYSKHQYIYSLMHTYAAGNLRVQSQYAYSTNFHAKTNFIDNSSFNVKAEYVLKTPSVLLGIDYEQIGGEFKNEVQDFLIKSSKLYKAYVATFFLKKKIKLNLSYNYLASDRSNSSLANQKLGVELATKFKSYPNISMSYKPYTTFRSLTDTFQIGQQQLVGSTTATRISYILKQQHHHYTISLNYTRNENKFDTILYDNNVKYLNIQYKNSLKSYSVNTNISINRTSSNVLNDTALLLNNTNNISIGFNANVFDNRMSISSIYNISYYAKTIQRNGLDIRCTLPDIMRFNVSPYVSVYKYSAILFNKTPYVYAIGLNLTYQIKNKND